MVVAVLNLVAVPSTPSRFNPNRIFREANESPIKTIKRLVLSIVGRRVSPLPDIDGLRRAKTNIRGQLNYNDLQQ